MACPWLGQAQSGATFGVKMNQPYGNFAESPYKAGGGVFGELFLGNFPKGLPFKFMPGIHGDYMWNAKESHDLNIVWLESARIGIRNHSAGLNGVLRLITDEAVVRLYGEAYVGARLFFTNTTTRFVDFEDEENQETDFIHHEMTQSYGWAAGLMIRLDQGVYLDMSAGRNWGSEVEFVDVKSSYLANDQLLYDMASTRSTGMLNFQLGLHFSFGSPPAKSYRPSRPASPKEPKSRDYRLPYPKS